MSVNIGDVHVRAFDNNLRHRVQQMGSKLMGRVTREQASGEAHRIDFIQPTDAIVAPARHADVTLANPTHNSRWLTTRLINWTDLLDSEDKRKMFVDPASRYAQNGAMAVGRQIDKIIVDALVGTAATGKGDSAFGSQAFDSNMVVAHDFVESGTAGAADKLLTIAKLRKARVLLGEAQVDLDNEELFWITTEKGINDLLRTTEVTSADYNTVKTLVNGEVDSFLGFTFIRLNGKVGGVNILPHEDVDTSEPGVINIAFARSGIALGVWKDMATVMTTRNDKVDHPQQIQVNASMGAVRLEEEKVVKIEVATAPTS